MPRENKSLKYLEAELKFEQTVERGSREGYGVFKRTRSFTPRYDFILL